MPEHLTDAELKEVHLEDIKHLIRVFSLFKSQLDVAANVDKYQI
jgi:hypothetical protein